MNNILEKYVKDKTAAYVKKLLAPLDNPEGESHLNISNLVIMTTF